jgi:hypothetical protein
MNDGALMGMVEGLDVSDPSDGLGAEGNMILKQSTHEDVVEVFATRQWSLGFLKICEFLYQMRNCQLRKKNAAAYSEFVYSNLPIFYIFL